MKVVLLTRYKDLGYKNDVIDVSDGFARNFLIPNRIAIYATDGAIKNAEENKIQGERKEQLIRKEVFDVLEKLKNTNIVVKVNVNNDGKLFCDITEQLIKKTIYDEVKYNVDRVIIGKPIRSLGKSRVKVKLYRDIATEVEIEVGKI